MQYIEQPRNITINVDNNSIEGTVEGTVEGWVFKSDNDYFIENFPNGEMARLDLKYNSPQAHKNIEEEVTKEVNKILA